jgi:hypothetical protein
VARAGDQARPREALVIRVAAFEGCRGGRYRPLPRRPAARVRRAGGTGCRLLAALPDDALRKTAGSARQPGEAAEAARRNLQRDFFRTRKGRRGGKAGAAQRPPDDRQHPAEAWSRSTLRTSSARCG